MPNFPRCQVVPLPRHETALILDGQEVTRWCFGQEYPRPFFSPLRGPSGTPLTRVGHPGAPDHDHHRSVWFAHAKAMGVNFWSDRSEASIRQKQWLVYEDSDDFAALAAALEWRDGHDPRPLLTQEMIAVARPADAGQWSLEIQCTFRPTAEQFEFQQTNFGFLAVRVAKHLSVHFGGGELRNDRGAVGERAIFGKPAQWIDYSGPTPAGGREGITYIDHPGNPGQPTRWHVREDGWMGASPCMRGTQITTRERPLRVRYLLWIHTGPPDPQAIAARQKGFAQSPGWRVSRSQRKHRFYELQPAV